MITTETKLEYEVKSVSDEAIPVIIVAAGASMRFGEENKQLAEINGVPVIARTMLAFEGSPDIKNIILVTRAEDVFIFQMLAEKYSISKLSDIVCGGATRQASVLKGFSRLDEGESAVLIHDGARPLVTEDIIHSVAEALKQRVAVTCAVPVKDTVKQVDKDGRVVKTLERDSLLAVQTPQGVKINEYLAAAERAGENSAFTDDMAVMENAGYEVYTVAGSYKNIKITTPEDILIAQAYEENGI